MTRLTKYTIQLISGLLLALLTAGCVADRNVSDCITEGEDVELEFALQVPALETSLRQLSADQEKQINSIQVLVFNTQDEQGTALAEPAETFAYEAKVKSFTTQADGTTLIRCGLTATSKKMRVVCIANANINTQGFTGKTKEVILNEDVMKKTFTAAWSTEGNNYYIPMWGESDAQAVSRATKFNDCTASNANGVIHLVRALARIDVGLSFDETKPADETAKGITDFKIKSVRVYRYAQSMFVTGTQALTFRQMGGNREPLPHTPEGMKAADDNNPLVFNADATGVDGYVRNIYIPEISNHLDNGQNKGKDARTCLVIGGSYKGGKETYYRVDFITRDIKSPKDIITKQLDVLRNHRYRFNITKVAGPGTEKPEEALTTEPVNLTCDVTVWDEGKIDKIVYDGQYYLSVSKDKFHFGKDATSENYTIRTNWPDGYKIVDKDGNEWAKTEADAKSKGTWAYFTATGSQKEIDTDMTNTVNVLANADGPRTIAPTELFVKAGRIKWPLKITQSDKIELDIKLYESNASGEYSPVNPINRLEVKQKDVKYVAVKYTKDAQLERRMMTDRELYTWVQVWDRPTDGLALYRVELHEGVLAEEQFALSEVSRFHANKGGAEADADLTVYNIIDDALPFGDRALTWNLITTPKNFALINDKPGFFFIKSSAPYRLKIVSIDLPSGSAQTDNTKVVHGWHKGMVVKEGQGQLTGDKIEFKPYDYVQGDDGVTAGSLSGASITFVIEHTDDSRYFPNKTFTIHFYAGIVQPTANCYIIKKGQELPIIFPVSERINEAADWYNAYEDSFDEAVYTRLKSYPARKNDYTNTGRALLNRLEANDEVWSVAVLWSTIDPTGSTSGLKVSKVVYQKTGQHNYMSVQTEGNVQPGSAVVACMKDGKVLWSWHIWVVDTYPWESAQTSAPLPVMNRNLGAAKKPAAGSVMGSNWPDPREMGMYYQYGRKDPFFAYEKLTGSFNQTNVPKIYYSDPKWKQGDAERSCGLGIDFRLFRMRDLIQQPTKMAYRDAQNEYILEFGTRDPNVAAGVHSSAASLAIWQGREAALEAKNSVRMVADLKTIKTPFDPSPYGWKVPSAGREADYIRNANWMNYRHYGFFHMGSYDAIDYVAKGDDCYFHLATRVSAFDVLGTFSYTEDGKVFGYGPAKRSDASNQEYCPANAMPVRPIINERETDYRRYTEDGFYMDKR